MRDALLLQCTNGRQRAEGCVAVVGSGISQQERQDDQQGHQGGAEQGPDHEALGRQPVTDYELATRLALFLWSSIPDDTLLALAEAGQLSRPDVLQAQIERMMNNKKVHTAIAKIKELFPIDEGVEP